MALATHTAHAPAGHGRRDRTHINRVGLWLFFFSETFLFALLFSSRFFLLGIDRAHVDQVLGLWITVILLASSATAFTAETAFEHDRRRLGIWMLVATILLGVIFAVGVGFEWATAEFSLKPAAGLSLEERQLEHTYATVFFTMTGVHAAHVISGVGLLTLVLLRTLRGRFNSKDHWPISGTVMYWHFVDVVWVFFYPALYLVS